MDRSGVFWDSIGAVSDTRDVMSGLGVAAGRFLSTLVATGVLNLGLGLLLEVGEIFKTVRGPREVVRSGDGLAVRFS